jgi:hypothetical protein
VLATAMCRNGSSSKDCPLFSPQYWRNWQGQKRDDLANAQVKQVGEGTPTDTVKIH